MPEQTLKGKVAVIGAGAKNLGGLISRTLGAEGASVVVHYNSDSTKAAADFSARHEGEHKNPGASSARRMRKPDAARGMPGQQGKRVADGFHGFGLVPARS